MRHPWFRSPGFSRRAAWFAGLVLAVVFHGVQAGTIVRFSTTYGDFSIETLDEAAPATAQNFLNYVNRGDYNGTFIHRITRASTDGLDVLQGGGYRFQSYAGPIAVPQDPPVVNEFSVSNTIGTLAMARFPGEPDSATSQWFINTKDNTALDAIDGGFTVFARVLGDGMNVVNEMVDNPVFRLGDLFPSVPLRSDTTGLLVPDNPNLYASIRANHFITVNTLVTQRFSSALHVFEYSSGHLITSVNGGEDGRFSLNLSLVASEPQIVFELNVDSMVPLAVTPDGAATWSSSDNRLRIPVIEINDNGNISYIRNAVFVLSDPALQRFTLESYEQ